MKKFNWDKFKRVFWFLLAILVVLIVWPLQDSFNDDIHTHRFCAYGEVYVEFEHNGHTWGTTYLDENGKPISCTDDDVQHTASNKEII